MRQGCGPPSGGLAFAGRPMQRRKSPSSMQQRALSLIDLQTHHGEHPRVGATDVALRPHSCVSMRTVCGWLTWWGNGSAANSKFPSFLRNRRRASLSGSSWNGFERRAERVGRTEMAWITGLRLETDRCVAGVRRLWWLSRQWPDDLGPGICWSSQSNCEGRSSVGQSLPV